MARPRRIVCYAINGSGLGHVTRLLGISRWMRRLATFIDGSPPEIFFLSSSEAPQLTLEGGFPTFKLPSKTVAREAGMDMLEYRRLAKHFIWNTLGVFGPDLLVVDTFPSGSFDELFQVLDGPFRKALILREVKREYSARPMFRAALRLYDQILVPGDAASVGRMALPEGLPVTPVGRLTHLDGQELLDRAEARRHLGVRGDAPLVYLSAGGGGDPTSADTLRSIAQALGELRCTVMIGAGPLYRGPKVVAEHVRWSTEPGLARCFRGFDAAVSAAGYNTFNELLLARVPTVFLPQEKVADDQRRRVEEAVAAGAALTVERGETDDPTAHVTTSAVVSAVRRLLAGQGGEATRAAMEDVFPSNHAAQCAARLLTELYPDEAVQRALAVLSPAFVHALPAMNRSEEADVFGRLLPAMTPPERRGGGAGASMERGVAALLPYLSENARAEVQAAVSHRTDGGWVGAVHRHAPRLVTAAAERATTARELAALVEVAMRKHPLTQEADTGAAAAWLAGVLGAVEGVVRAGPDVATLYRYWPKVVDADCAQAFALFERFVEAGGVADEAGQAWELQRTLSGLKATVKRVRRADVETWVEQLAVKRTGVGAV